MSVEWIRNAPFYELPTPQRVECGPGYGSQPLAVSMMQAWVNNVVGWPQGFLYGAGAGTGNQTPKSLLDQAVMMALALTDSPVARYTCAGFEPISEAVQYTQIAFDILKRTPATIGMPLADPNASVWDIWVAYKRV